jgi:hypothetical protein
MARSRLLVAALACAAIGLGSAFQGGCLTHFSKVKLRSAQGLRTPTHLRRSGVRAGSSRSAPRMSGADDLDMGAFFAEVR